jgi:putative endonuclease
LADLPAGRQAQGTRMYCVYVLKSLKDENLYIGMTSDLEQRIKRHNSGYEKATKRRAPFKLLHSEDFETRIEARNREKYFKSGFGREIIKSLFVI